jgi:hypothetical protein
MTLPFSFRTMVRSLIFDLNHYFYYARQKYLQRSTRFTNNEVRDILVVHAARNSDVAIIDQHPGIWEFSGWYVGRRASAFERRIAIMTSVKLSLKSAEWNIRAMLTSAKALLKDHLAGGASLANAGLKLTPKTKPLLNR